MKKRLTSICLALALSASLTVPALAATSFSDVPTTAWYHPYVTELAEEGIIGGIGNGQFAPNNYLTWGEALKLLMLTVGYEKQDRTGAHWASGYITKAAADGLISADVNPDEYISRLVFCQIAAKAAKLTASGAESPFSDTDDAGVLALYEAGIIGGIGNGQFAPDNDLTRAEISKIIWKLRNRQTQQPASPYEWSVTPGELKFRTSTDAYFGPTEDTKRVQLLITDPANGLKDAADDDFVVYGEYYFESSDTSVIDVDWLSGLVYNPVMLSKGDAPRTATIRVIKGHPTNTERQEAIEIPVTVSYYATADDEVFTEEKGWYLPDEAYTKAFTEEFFKLFNEFRQEEGLSTVEYVFSAQECVNEYCRQNILPDWNHNGALKSQLLKEYGVADKLGGENLYRSGDTLDNGYTYLSPEKLAAQVLNGWKSSPAHRSSMVGKHLDKIVVGIYVAEDQIYSALWMGNDFD